MTWDDETTSEWDDEPELAGYVPSSGRPLRGRKLLIAARIFMVVAIVLLVLPNVLMMLGSNAANAAEACRRWVKYEDPSSPSSRVAFEVLGAHGTGWQCYTSGDFGGDTFVASLGPIPGVPVIPGQ